MQLNAALHGVTPRKAYEAYESYTANGTALVVAPLLQSVNGVSSPNFSTHYDFRSLLTDRNHIYIHTYIHSVYPFTGIIQFKGQSR